MDTAPAARLLTDEEAASYVRGRRLRRVRRVVVLVAILAFVVTLGPPVWRHLTATAELTLAGAEVEWWLERGAWRKGGVTRVQLSDGPVMVTDSSLPRLKNLHNLVALDLSRCEQLTDAGVSVLGELRGLEELDLSRPPAQPRFLETPKNPELTDAALIPLQKLTRLKSLSLMDTQVTDDGLTRLAGLSNLEVLDLSGTQVTNNGLKHLKVLKRLKRVVATNTKVSVEGAIDLERTIPGIEVDFDRKLEEDDAFRSSEP